MLYVLLVIIAVGVLLISPTGKGILKWTAILAAIGAGLFLAIALIVSVWAEYGAIAGIGTALVVIGVVLKIVEYCKNWMKRFRGY